MLWIAKNIEIFFIESLVKKRHEKMRRISVSASHLIQRAYECGTSYAILFAII